MNEQYFNSEISLVRTQKPLQSLHAVKQTQDSATQDKACVSNDSSVCFMEPIMLDKEGKQAFLNLVERPAQANKKLLAALCKLQ